MLFDLHLIAADFRWVGWHPYRSWAVRQVSLDQMRLEGSKNSHLLLGVDAFEHAPQNQL